MRMTRLHRTSHSSLVVPLVFAGALAGCSSSESPLASQDGGAVDAGTHADSAAPVDGSTARDASTAADAAADASRDGGVTDTDAGMTCTLQSTCPAVTCLCANAGDPCGAAAQTVDVQLCQAQRCVTDPATVCPSVCGPMSVWVHPSLPTSQPFGTSWTEVTTPGTFDFVVSAAGTSDDDFVVIANSNYPQFSAIRSGVWAYKNGAFVDRTPTLLTTFDPSVRYENAWGLATDGSAIYIATQGLTAASSNFGKAYALTGTTATPIADGITSGSSEMWTLAWRNGTLLLGGRSAAGHPILATRTGTTTQTLTVPTPEANYFGAFALFSEPAPTGPLWVMSPAHVAAIDGATVTNVPLPSEVQAPSVRWIARANGKLFAQIAPTGIPSAALWSWDGMAWTSVCTPDRGVERIAPLRDGSLFAATKAGAYVFDGTTWKKLPSSTTIDSAYGSGTKVFGFVDGPSARGKVVALVP